MEPALLHAADPISYTARIVAAKRAIEQRCPTPLFSDPYAAALAGDEVDALLTRWQTVAEAQSIPFEQVMTKRIRYIAIRTKFMDDLLLAALAEMESPQVVILGAGLDTRAYRLTGLANAIVYEVDCPNLLQYKAQMLQNISPICTYRPVAGDLAELDATWVTRILDAGYQTTIPTLWLLEGVMMYLQEANVHHLIQILSKLSLPASILGMDGVKVGSIVAGQRARQADRGRVVRHWQFGHNDPKHLLDQYGWVATVREPQEVEGGYGRYPQSLPVGTEPTDQDEGRGVWLLKAVKR